MWQEGSRAACAAAYDPQLLFSEDVPQGMILTNPYSGLYFSFLHLFLRGSLTGPYPVLQTLPLLAELFPELLGEVSHL